MGASGFALRCGVALAGVAVSAAFSSGGVVAHAPSSTASNAPDANEYRIFFMNSLFTLNLRCWRRGHRRWWHIGRHHHRHLSRRWCHALHRLYASASPTRSGRLFQAGQHQFLGFLAFAYYDPVGKDCFQLPFTHCFAQLDLSSLGIWLFRSQESRLHARRDNDSQQHQFLFRGSRRFWRRLFLGRWRWLGAARGDE